MTRQANPSIPPSVAKHVPNDPFEVWLTRQAIAGYSRAWLNANKVPLQKRFKERPGQDLPPPEPPPLGRKHDRYEEL